MQEKVIAFPEPTPDDHAHSVTPSIPISLTSLIGREQEVEAIKALLSRPDVRLLTLTGTAGVGKTRLALEVARELVGDFADGVHVVSLAPISDPAFVIPTIAHTLGLTESASQSFLELLKSSQRNKHQLLLLDNFEHVIEVAPLLVELLEACPGLKFLVTSREVLRLRAEHQFVVPPLALPDPKHLLDDRSIEDVPAVQLFLQRAQAIRSDFQLTTDNAEVIAEICLRLDGLPLAIELAAARIKLLPPKALLMRLSRRLTVLTRGSLDAPARQQTLRDTLAWRYQLLDTQEQRLFRRLSIFAGGCTLQAIEAIGAALDDEVGQIFEGVASLLDKSLLRQMEQEGEEPRLLMLETIREYGLECLVKCEEMELARQAHAEYYLRLAEQAQPELIGPQQAAWLQQLEREHENLRATMGWLLEPEEAEHRTDKALRFGEALRKFWLIRGYWSEGRTFLEQVLARNEGVVTSLRAHVLYNAAELAYIQDDYEQGGALCEESLALFRSIRDKAGIADCLYLLGGGGQDWWGEARTRGTLAEARALTEEALALQREMGDKRGIAYDLFSLACLLSHEGEYASARAGFRKAWSCRERWGTPRA